MRMWLHKLAALYTVMDDLMCASAPRLLRVEHNVSQSLNLLLFSLESKKKYVISCLFLPKSSFSMLLHHSRTLSIRGFHSS